MAPNTTYPAVSLLKKIQDIKPGAMNEILSQAEEIGKVRSENQQQELAGWRTRLKDFFDGFTSVMYPPVRGPIISSKVEDMRFESKLEAAFADLGTAWEAVAESLSTATRDYIIDHELLEQGLEITEEEAQSIDWGAETQSRPFHGNHPGFDGP